MYRSLCDRPLILQVIRRCVGSCVQRRHSSACCCAFSVSLCLLRQLGLLFIIRYFSRFFSCFPASYYFLDNGSQKEGKAFYQQLTHPFPLPHSCQSYKRSFFIHQLQLFFVSFILSPTNYLHPSPTSASRKPLTTTSCFLFVMLRRLY